MKNLAEDEPTGTDVKTFVGPEKPGRQFVTDPTAAEIAFPPGFYLLYFVCFVFRKFSSFAASAFFARRFRTKNQKIKIKNCITTRIYAHLWLD